MMRREFITLLGGVLSVSHCMSGAAQEGYSGAGRARLGGGSAVCESRSLNDNISIMILEIERKFLVANDGWKNSVVRSVRIRDGLIANNKGNKARVRIANDVATIALKSRRSGLARAEFEYVIPYSDAEEMLRIMCEGNVARQGRGFWRSGG